MDIDMEQASRLADLINTSIAWLKQASHSFVQGAEELADARRKREHEERETVLTIASAGTQLAALVRPPAQVILEVATSFTLAAALRLVVEAHVPEIIRTLSDSMQESKKGHEGGHVTGVPISEISRLCGINAMKLERILRLLATHLIFAECPSYEATSYSSTTGDYEKSSVHPDTNAKQSVGEARFTHTRLSVVLDSGAALEDILDISPNDILASLNHLPSKLGERVGNGFTSVTQAEMERRRNVRWAAKYGGEAPGSGLAALIGILTDESMFHATALPDVLLPMTPEPPLEVRVGSNKTHLNGERITPEPSEDEDGPLSAPFSRARNLPRTSMFDWLNAPENAHRLHRFSSAMRGMGGLTPDGAILKGFNFASLPNGATIVDVGGGVGLASLPLLRAYSHLSLIVQDTEEVVRVASKFWEVQYPDALSDGRVTFQVQSFFDPQPGFHFTAATESKTDTMASAESTTSNGPAVFLLRMIMHNWPDAHCERILSRLRAAAGERTKLVLIDNILMSACRIPQYRSMDGDEASASNISASNKVSEAPEPLLANWGTANGLAYKLDLIMLANHNAGERTLAAFESLLIRTGWAIVEVHAASESWLPQIVAVPSPVPSSLH